jgi:hypothetical protein
VLAVAQLWGLALLGWLFRDEPAFWSSLSLLLFFTVATIAITAAATAFGVEAIEDGKLPPRPGDKPQHHHITGFGALFLAAIVIGIIILATAATTDRNIDRQIHAQWGAFIVFLLIGLFVAAATVPNFGVPTWIARAGSVAGRVLRPFGRFLSVVDSALVHAVAPSVGVTVQRRWTGRYLFLAAYLTPLGLLGYCLPAPWGLLPVAWALVAAISVSRRWSWVEDDRETAMLTAQFRGENLRVGFDHDLRDEALIAFSSMFVFVPLALRQAQLWGATAGVEVFSVTGVDVNNVYYWIQYFGSELAKAVPFVDWAEVYDVKGDGPIETSSIVSRHVVFATRVLVDLVFLATLLQVLSTFSRNAKQIEMFREGAIDRFDPFMERGQLKELVVWDGEKWIAEPSRLSGFGTRRKYNLTRLLELRDERQAAQASVGAETQRRQDIWAVWAAADFIYDRDYQDGEVVDQLYAKLREVGLSFEWPRNKDAIAEVLDQLEKPGRRIDYTDLNDVREHLNKYATSWPLRSRLITLMGRASFGEDLEDRYLRISSLAAALSGERRSDSRAPNRRLAFEFLKEAYLEGDDVAVRAMLSAAEKDQSIVLKAEIRNFVETNPRSIRVLAEDPSPQV